jgi:hypothetical protein
MQPPYVFYILSKGNYAGKPSFTPWANSFMIITGNQPSLEFYFWLCYGLHNAGRFRYYHTGSVIPFLKVGNVSEAISEVAPIFHPHWQQYNQIISSLSQLEKKKATLAQHILSTERLQKQLLHHYFIQKTKGAF